MTAFPVAHFSCSSLKPRQEPSVDVALLVATKLRSTASLVADTNRRAYSRGW
jgi:hypothetical protein